MYDNHMEGGLTDIKFFFAATTWRKALRTHSYLLAFRGFFMTPSINVDPYIWTQGVITRLVEQKNVKNSLIYSVF